jgi:hypothetical protein
MMYQYIREISEMGREDIDAAGGILHRATCWNVQGAGSRHPGAQGELGCGPPWNSAELTTSDQTMCLDQHSEPL